MYTYIHIFTMMWCAFKAVIVISKDLVQSAVHFAILYTMVSGNVQLIETSGRRWLSFRECVPAAQLHLSSWLKKTVLGFHAAWGLQSKGEQYKAGSSDQPHKKPDNGCQSGAKSPHAASMHSVYIIAHVDWIRKQTQLQQSERYLTQGSGTSQPSILHANNGIGNVILGVILLEAALYREGHKVPFHINLQQYGI